MESNPPPKRRKYGGSDSKSAHKRMERVRSKTAPAPESNVKSKHDKPHDMRHHDNPFLNFSPVITAVGGGPEPMVMNPSNGGNRDRPVTLQGLIGSTTFSPRAVAGFEHLIKLSM